MYQTGIDKTDAVTDVFTTWNNFLQNVFKDNCLKCYFIFVNFFSVFDMKYKMNKTPRYLQILFY